MGIPSASRARSSFCLRLVCFFAFAILDRCRQMTKSLRSASPKAIF
jgi:hypothetical protein